jgi:flagellar biosynthesis protein FliR
MFEVYRFSEVEILSFILVLMRISVFLVTWPVFGTASVPTSAKVLTSLIVTIVLFPIVGIHRLDAAAIERFYFWLLMREALIGITLGFLTRFFFFTISVCAQIVSDSIGLSSVQLFDPSIQDRSTVIEQFYTMLATLFFLGINGHHAFISGLVQSYEIVPLSLKALNLATYQNVGPLVQAVTVAGIKLSAPVFIAIFCMNIAMGIIGRAVPQINVLVTTIPVNILVGLFVMLISIPLLLASMSGLLNEAIVGVFGFLKSY